MYQNVRFLDEAMTKKSILPCTPLAVIKILEYLRIYNTILPYGNRLHGRTITVINRSEVVGRPLAALLANDGAHVYSVDINDVQVFTRGTGLRKNRHEVEEKPGWTINDCLPVSDVVISGVPGDVYKVPLENMRDGAVCINFSSERNFSPEVKEKASIYVPAIGKVTIVVLLRNLLVSACEPPERTFCLQFCSAWFRIRSQQPRLRRNRLRRSHHKCFADKCAPSYFPFSRYPIEGISPQRLSIASYMSSILFVFLFIHMPEHDALRVLHGSEPMGNGMLLKHCFHLNIALDVELLCL
jgi:hypothetical protein